MMFNSNYQFETSENFSNPWNHIQTPEISNSEITIATPTRALAPKIEPRNLIKLPHRYSPEWKQIYIVFII